MFPKLHHTFFPTVPFHLSNSSINTNSTTLVKNMSDSGHETGTEHSQTSSVQPSKHHPQTSKLKKIGQTFKKMFTPVSCSSTNSSLVVQCTKPGAFDVVNGNNDKFKNDHHDLETSNSADDTKVLRMIPGLEAGFPLKGRPPSVPRGLALRGAPPPPGGGCSNPNFRSFKT